MWRLISCLFTLSLILSAACNRGVTGNEPTDTPTSGSVTVCVDESYKLLFDTQEYTFESFYENANVKIIYTDEKTSMQNMINDSCKVVVINRALTAEEKKYFEQHNLFPTQTKIAEDAVALVVNKENYDSTLTVEQFKNILLGVDSTWKQINAASTNDKINVVFDNPNSANYRYMKDSLLQGKEFSKNVFAVKSNPEVIDYVAQHKNSIGVLSVNWISDKDDSISRSFLKTIRVMGVRKFEDTKAYKPYQAYIATKDYPFCRSVYMINRQTRAGLGTGFVSFVAGNKGQMMILKMGLIPAVAPVRMVEINTN
ncbi:MAG: substrate-binding domain-containing protein [Bacteroidetes bacterium]|nr:substrate-binding domain-containing protein [Bacteroidota bacterium]